jgi:hypothetical protein
MTVQGPEWTKPGRWAKADAEAVDLSYVRNDATALLGGASKSASVGNVVG